MSEEPDTRRHVLIMTANALVSRKRWFGLFGGEKWVPVTVRIETTGPCFFRDISIKSSKQADADMRKWAMEARSPSAEDDR